LKLEIAQAVAQRRLSLSTGFRPAESASRRRMT
jgi:hypothetical protein